MNGWIVVLVAAGLLGLRRVRPGMLVWLGAWWVGVFVVLRYGFVVPIPVSVLKIYMSIVSGSLLAYVLADSARWRQVAEPLTAFMTEKRHQTALVAVALAIPAFFGYQVYAGITKDPVTPSFGRTIHPAPPDSITVHDKEFNLITLDNPYRELQHNDPEAFREHVEAGRTVYYQNCFYCHGDLLSGAGMFAHGLNPIPSNFQDPNVIPILQEGFLFWRIAKGAPGLPEESAPWDSAMPAWDNFLSEEDVWNVIVFLTDFTQYTPRARGGGHE